jgi:hypothetical protein
MLNQFNNIHSVSEAGSPVNYRESQGGVQEMSIFMKGSQIKTYTIQNIFGDKQRLKARG